MKELLAPLVETAVYAIAAVGFTLAGVFAELSSFEYINTGNVPFAIWLFAMGAVALYAGIFALGIEKVLPRLRETLSDA
jgi:hypothetical protein